MGSGAISNARLKASSNAGSDHAASQGRLNFQETRFRAGAWAAGANNVYQWLQIDLGNKNTKVTLVATQGRNYRGNWRAGYHSQWVTRYKLQYSDNGVRFQYYKEEGKQRDKVRNFS